MLQQWRNLRIAIQQIIPQIFPDEIPLTKRQSPINIRSPMIKCHPECPNHAAILKFPTHGIILVYLKAKGHASVHHENDFAQLVLLRDDYLLAWHVPGFEFSEQVDHEVAVESVVPRQHAVGADVAPHFETKKGLAFEAEEGAEGLQEISKEETAEQAVLNLVR